MAPTLSLWVLFHVICLFPCLSPSSFYCLKSPFSPPQFFPTWIHLTHPIRLISCAAFFQKPSLILFQVGGLFCPPGKTPLSSQNPWAYLTPSICQIMLKVTVCISPSPLDWGCFWRSGFSLFGYSHCLVQVLAWRSWSIDVCFIEQRPFFPSWNFSWLKLLVDLEHFYTWRHHLMLLMWRFPSGLGIRKFLQPDEVFWTCRGWWVFGLLVWARAIVWSPVLWAWQ